MPQIDPSAKVDPRAELADDVVVGAYTLIEGPVRVGAGTHIDAHCVIRGHTDIGERNRIYPFTVLGTSPQDHTYKGEPTKILIGDDNVFREYVTVNVGTLKGGGITVIGDHNMFMASSHVAHDCILGDRVVMSNGALLAGHVKVEDGVIFSGHCAVHHFVTLGAVCMVGGLTGVTRDVPPFMMMVGDHRVPRGVNVVGMSRNGYTRDEVRSIQRAFRMVYRSELSAREARAELEASGGLTAPVRKFLDFVARSELGTNGRYLETTRKEREVLFETA
jgi:UDP-N-acetylglucosamine acyltransferase